MSLILASIKYTHNRMRWNSNAMTLTFSPKHDSWLSFK